MILLDSSFFKSELVIKYKRFVENQGKRCLHYDGIIVLEMLIMLSADGVEFIDARDFIEKADAPKGTALLVWDYCLENQILTLNADGFYSAKGWVEQNGFLIGNNNPNPEKKTGYYDDEIWGY